MKTLIEHAEILKVRVNQGVKITQRHAEWMVAAIWADAMESAWSGGQRKEFHVDINNKPKETTIAERIRLNGYQDGRFK